MKVVYTGALERFRLWFTTPRRTAKPEWEGDKTSPLQKKGDNMKVVYVGANGDSDVCKDFWGNTFLKNTPIEITDPEAMEHYKKKCAIKGSHFKIDESGNRGPGRPPKE